VEVEPVAVDLDQHTGCGVISTVPPRRSPLVDDAKGNGDPDEDEHAGADAEDESGDAARSPLGLGRGWWFLG
jgi:hypothetical protein